MGNQNSNADLSVDVIQVTNMTDMFREADATARSADMSWDIRQVTDMSDMFREFWPSNDPRLKAERLCAFAQQPLGRVRIHTVSMYI